MNGNKCENETILVVSPVVCYPTNFGNARRIASIVEQLMKSGKNVYYLYLPERKEGTWDMKNRLGDRFLEVPFTTKKSVRRKLRLRLIKSFIKGEKARVIRVDDLIEDDYIDFYRNAISKIQPGMVLVNYTYYSKLLLETPPSIRKILETHDSLHIRYHQLYADKPFLHRYHIKLSNEVEALNRADEVICIQKNELELFRKAGVSSRLRLLGHLADYKGQKSSSGDRATGGMRLLYLGAAYQQNVEDILLFLEKYWMDLIHRITGLRLEIAGGVCSLLEKSVESYPGVSVRGEVESLETLYKEIDVSINPVSKGSGLKIKTIEALSYGIPVLTTTTGADGLEEFIDKGLFITNDEKNWHLALNHLSSTFAYDKVQWELRNTFLQYKKRSDDELIKIFSYKDE